jgi:hypothetical protein
MTLQPEKPCGSLNPEIQAYTEQSFLNPMQTFGNGPQELSEIISQLENTGDNTEASSVGRQLAGAMALVGVFMAENPPPSNPNFSDPASTTVFTIIDQLAWHCGEEDTDNFVHDPEVGRVFAKLGDNTAQDILIRLARRIVDRGGTVEDRRVELLKGVIKPLLSREGMSIVDESLEYITKTERAAAVQKEINLRPMKELILFRTASKDLDDALVADPAQYQTLRAEIDAMGPSQILQYSEWPQYHQRLYLQLDSKLIELGRQRESAIRVEDITIAKANLNAFLKRTLLNNGKGTIDISELSSCIADLFPDVDTLESFVEQYGPTTFVSDGDDAKECLSDRLYRMWRKDTIRVRLTQMRRDAGVESELQAKVEQDSLMQNNQTKGVAYTNIDDLEADLRAFFVYSLTDKLRGKNPNGPDRAPTASQNDKPTMGRSRTKTDEMILQTDILEPLKEFLNTPAEGTIALNTKWLRDYRQSQYGSRKLGDTNFRGYRMFIQTEMVDGQKTYTLTMGSGSHGFERYRGHDISEYAAFNDRPLTLTQLQ